jgi:peptidoglycan/xylan/chitin deacetylase (PgdA/CDA1 family)
VTSARLAAKALFSLVDLLRSDFPGPRILIYHQIGAGHGRQMDVRPDVFRRHLDWIEASGGRVVSLADALENAGRPETRSWYVLTFDDGYQDMFTNGFDVLRERQLPFTVYLTTAPTCTGTPLASDRSAHPLSWEHLDEMRASGLMTLGVHTHTHPDLRRISPVAIAHELETSDRIIEENTGVRPRHFAYPWGYSSKPAEEIVSARYDTAVLGGGGPVLVDTERHRIHRIPVQLSDGVMIFKRKMRRGQRTEEWARRLASVGREALASRLPR